MSKGGSWSTNEDETIKKGLAQGLSAGQISLRLQGRTRSAVLGRIHRLERKPGLSLPRSGQRGPDLRRGTVRKAAVHNAKRAAKAQAFNFPIKGVFDGAPFVAEPDLVIPESERQTLLVHDARGRLCANDKFHAGCCRWPIGDPIDPAFHFCGREAQVGLPYCQFHAERAFQKMPPKRIKPEPIPTFADSEKEPA
jgi:GcrA cell cycle regulator